MSAPVPIPRAPPPPGMETYREKAVRKFKENPWVPLGCGATVTALVVAMVKMRQGKSNSFNHWLRVRVAAQGLTLVALCAGTWAMRPKDATEGVMNAPVVAGAHPVADRAGTDDGTAPGVASGELGLVPGSTRTVGQAVSIMPRNEQDVERRRQEKVAKEREEFEERLKGAEEQMKLEEAFKEGAKKRAAEAASAGIKSPHEPTVGEKIAAEGTKSTGSWLGWLGMGGGKKDKDGEASS